MTAMRTKPATVVHWLGGIDGAMPVVFIHGFGADRYAWAANAPALFDSHAVYALDLPGHGNGARPTAGLDMPGLAEDVAAALDTALGTPYALVGHSLGGAIALMVAARTPETVAHVVTIAPAGLGRSLDREFLESLPELETVEDAKSLLEKLVARPRHIGLPMAQHLLAGLEIPGRREDLRIIARMLASLDRYDAPAVETTWIWGALDAINPLDADSLDSGVVSVNVVPDAGHMPQIESAPKVNRLIKAALANC